VRRAALDPADFNEAVGLWSTRAFHVLAVVLLALTGYVQGPDLSTTSRRRVRGPAVLRELADAQGRLGQVGVAFMTMNGIISVVFLFFTTLGLFVP